MPRLVYTANTNDSGEVVAFKHRGISNLMPVMASDVHIQAFSVAARNSSYYDYVYNVHDAAYATITGEIVHKATPFRKILESIPCSLWNRPNLVVGMKGIGASEEAALLKFGMVRDSTDSEMWTGTPSAKDAKEIMMMSPGVKQKPGTIDAAGYLSYFTAMRGLRALAVMTETYTMKHSATRIDPNTFANTAIDLKTATSVPTATTGQTVSYAPATGGHGAYDTIIFTPNGVSVYVPINNKKSFTTCVADISKIIPHDSGLVFPFFSNLLQADKDFVFNKVKQYLFRCLADNASDAAKRLKIMRPGLRSMAALPAGRMLSHMFLGIDLAVASQSRIRFVSSGGEYVGFLLFSEHLRVVHRGMVIEPEDQMALPDSIKQLDSHHEALSKIVAIIKSVRNADGEPVYPCTIESIDTPRLLNKLINKVVKTDLTSEQWLDLDTAVESVAYEQEFWTINTSNILQFLNYCATWDESILEHAPMYYSGSFYKASNKIELALLAFGKSAPTFAIGGMKKMVIPTSATAIDNNLAIDEDKHRVWRYFAYKKVPVKVAAIDWSEIFLKGVIYYPEPRKDKQEWINLSKTSGHISHDQGVVAIYEALKPIVVFTASQAGNDASKKRVAEGQGARVQKKSRQEKKDEDRANAMLF